MKNLFLPLFLMTGILLVSSPVWAKPEAPVHLILSRGPTTTYTPNVLSITQIGGKTIAGKMDLQFDIGPQSRLPQTWERTQSVTFSGKFVPESGRVEFSVKVQLGSGNSTLQFVGFRFHDGQMAGIYKLDGKEYGAFMTRPVPRPKGPGHNVLAPEF